MAIYRQGIATSIGTRFVNSVSNTGGGNGNNQTLTNAIQNLSSTFLPVRVTDIVLNDKHPKYGNVGEWNGIGTIFFQYMDRTVPSKAFAYPLTPQMKNYPLVNEVVFLIAVPSKFVPGTGNYALEYYYLPATGIWNHPHHNAYPDVKSYEQLSPESSNDYVSTGINGSYVRRVEDDSTEINLNSPTNQSQQTFVEKSDIHPLLPFPGDIIYEGRWGNSLRFGSTSKPPLDTPLTQMPSPEYQNNWSDTGNNGDPITILRNGQNPNSSDEGWIPIVENTKTDLSSIYLTSYQKIPFSIANENFVSYTTPPTTPSQFTNPQIILNSDRVVINAKKDSVLISGEKSVGLSSNNSVNIEAKQIYLDGTDIRLGRKNASQSVLKGDDTVTYLKILINELKNLTEALKVIQDWPGGVSAPNSTMLAVANSAQKIFENVYDNIDNVKSNFVKTI